MDIRGYHDYTRLLIQALEKNPKVIALVALGSMVELDYHPDQWSDHDFFVISEPGAQEEFRSDLSWLPEDDQIAFWFRETEHGLKVVYENGHLLEFAVFDLQELELAKVDRFRVLFDRGRVKNALDQITARTILDAESAVVDDSLLFGQFLTNLMVGVGRYQRGERLSGDEHTKRYAFSHLVALINKYLPSPNANLLDRLAPSRRFEFVYPELASEMEQLLYMPAPEAAAQMLTIASRELETAAPDFPAREAALVQRYLNSIDD
jgi:lincosamide nucleotidyltransferase